MTDHHEQDEAFVALAPRRELSADERAEQAARIAADHGSRTAWRSDGPAVLPSQGWPAPRPQRRGDRRGRLVALCAAAGLTAAWASGALPTVGAAGAAAAGAVPRSDPASSTRLLPAPPVPDAGAGRYTFLGTAADGRTPVTWDPCRPVHVVVRPDGEIAGGEALLEDALAEVGEATGLELVLDGTTQEGPSDGRAPYQPGRYGRDWAPVLVAWSDPAESPELAGTITGYAAPLPYARRGRPQRYVTGQVVLDAPQLTAELAQPAGAEAVRGVLLHELAHLVGLGHVADPTQVMNPVEGRTGPFDYADGDRRGLALLSGTC